MTNKTEPATPPDSPLLRIVKDAAHENPAEAILILANVLEKSITHTRHAEELAGSAVESSSATLAIVKGLQESIGRIETRLRTNEQATDRATSQHDIVEGFAKLALAREQDEVSARRDHRKARIAAAGRVVGFIASTAGLGLILSFVLKSCGNAHADAAQPASEPPAIEAGEIGGP